MEGGRRRCGRQSLPASVKAMNMISTRTVAGQPAATTDDGVDLEATLDPVVINR